MLRNRKERSQELSKLYEDFRKAEEEKSEWHLEVERGRQVWVHDRAREHTHVDQHHLGEEETKRTFSGRGTASTLDETVQRASEYFSSLQTDDGHWAGDYGGPMFLLPGMVIAGYVSGFLPELGEARFRQIIRYLTFQQHEDGGWGLHNEGPSTIFGTALSYVTLRILGLSSQDPRIVRARTFLHANDGAKAIPSWGKFWLSVLGVYEWEGCHAITPELWLLPYWLPIHPGRWWCHCRIVYLPMGYIFGKRIVGPRTPLVDALRDELYTESYKSIDWPSLRSYVSPLDLYFPHTTVLEMLFKVVDFYEGVHLESLRTMACEKILEHVIAEDDSTKGICIGPVNKSLNALVIWHAEGSASPNFVRHKERMLDYLWLGVDGMKMQGYNGSQLWDTAFALQALASHSGKAVAASSLDPTLRKGLEYLAVSQVLEDVPNRHRFYRHRSKGAWPFSTHDHGWPISDCTAEGLKATLVLQSLPGMPQLVSDERLQWAVDVLLSLQNRQDGGWATYENRRAPVQLEWINPAEVYDKIMVDYSYVECTSACVQALVKFRDSFPSHRQGEVLRAIQRGVAFIKSIQLGDGSWYGSWAVCYTYGTWFGCEALAAAGESYHTCPELRRACTFLVGHQKPDGAWGETFESCSTHKYCDNPVAQPINTAWAMLALMRAGYPDRAVLDRAAHSLRLSQLPNGDWDRDETISAGVFNANCSITYSNYRNIFPIWALGLYNSTYGNE